MGIEQSRLQIQKSMTNRLAINLHDDTTEKSVLEFNALRESG